MTATTETRTEVVTVWMDGRLFEPGEPAAVSVLDHGLIVGDGVFEALKVTPDGPFAVGRHLARMTRSARALGLPDPDHDAVRGAIAEVLARRTYADGRVRITYTGGPGPLGSQAPFGPPS